MAALYAFFMPTVRDQTWRCEELGWVIFGKGKFPIHKEQRLGFITKKNNIRETK
jgi:hypothetical protein